MLSCPVCNRAFKDMRSESAQDSIILNHILLCSSSVAGVEQSNSRSDTSTRSTTIRTTRSSARSRDRKSIEVKTCFPCPTKRSPRFSSQKRSIRTAKSLPPPLSKRSRSSSTKLPSPIKSDTTRATTHAKRPLKASAPKKRTIELRSSSPQVAPSKKPHHRNGNADSHESTNKDTPYQKKTRRSSTAEQQRQKPPDVKHLNNDLVESNKGRRKGAVSRTCPLCKRVFHMSKVSLAEVASHISRCCDANFPMRKPVTKEPKKRRITRPDDKLEVGQRKDSLRFLRGREAKSVLEDSVLCYLDTF